MENEKVFCGNGKVITTQYGEMTKISFSAQDLEKLQANLENGWVNTVLKAKKEPVEGKPTHYLEVDKWRPSGDSTPKQNGAPKEEESDFPF
jgi:hypothetical protein